MEVLTVLGTRPEAIKLAPIIRLLRQQEAIASRVCVTGQHRELLMPFLRLFRIEPSINLEIMEEDQALSQLTSRAMTAISDVLQTERPDVVLVHGDTTTALVAAQAAFYQRIPLGHVEAGLRTGNKYDPFPEEMNRTWIDSVADFLFAPTARSRDNLLKEGAEESRIHVCGNTVVDALLWICREQSEGGQDRRLAERLAEEHGVPLDDRRILLVTGHRRESFGEPFEQICLALRQIAERNPGVLLVYPVHLNPNVRRPVGRILSGVENVKLIEPLGYEEFVFLMRHAYLILTDSGGIQEEAPSLKTPVLVMRNETERPEAIEAGVAKLVGTRTETIVRTAQDLLDDPTEYRDMVAAGNPFGDGHAAERIVAVLTEHLTGR